MAALISFGVSPALLVGCGGGGGGGPIPNQQLLSVLPSASPQCGGPSLPTCNGTYHLSIHSSGGVDLGLVFDWAESRLPGDNIGITGGAQVRPGQGYTFKAVPDNAKLWLQLNGKSIPDTGTIDLNLTPGFDNTLFAYIAIMPGDPAPEFKGLDANGKLHSLSALRGKWTLVTFGDWGCPGARNFAPVLASIYSQYHSLGLEVLSVLDAPNMELRVSGPADLNDWARTYGVNYPLINDPDNATQYYNREYLSCTFYSCSDNPSIFLVNPQGTIAYRYRGWDANDGLAGVLAKLYA
jgi:peroxiredoxin